MLQIRKTMTLRACLLIITMQEVAKFSSPSAKLNNKLRQSNRQVQLEGTTQV